MGIIQCLVESPPIGQQCCAANEQMVGRLAERGEGLLVEGQSLY
jgi:hypothetical protein